MKVADIRRSFLDYFQLRGHELIPSGPLVPPDDPTLLFTNAGMVQFKGIFQGEERVPYRRAVTAQKCVRAGGKHNDLEQVGRTARHHTFFEMLGNFSFGDYFKKEAIHFAWELLTGELGIESSRIYVTVHETDDEAHTLWRDVTGIPVKRIFRLGDKDNFWQMADTGPCGPCSELHYDLRPKSRARAPSNAVEFEALSESGELIELWNLVFMQFDRDAEGNLSSLPAPSIDTGAGLERLAAVLQEVDSNYHTDAFLPLLERVAEIVGRPYRPDEPEGVSYRVLADHARAVAFLLADGVTPSSDGRGYVLRRILRRAVRHAWLLGLEEPTLVGVVEEVVSEMRGVYPELGERASQILDATRSEEERFLTTIEGGMSRIDEIAPVKPGAKGAGEGTISGAEAFRLYDTFGFPLDLTQLVARERGYEVDEEGFLHALGKQRERSRADLADTDRGASRVPGLDQWTILGDGLEQEWVGWHAREADTELVAYVNENGRAGVILAANPFYVEAGGQVSDEGVVEGEGWRIRVEEVRRLEGTTALFGPVEGELPKAPPGRVAARARVNEESRHDTERNHTATHLLHAALRKILGTHVTQKGSLVEPERLRFDFSHPEPVSTERLEAIEAEVNRRVWEDHPVTWRLTSREEATAAGAMALFGEKYAEEVRMVEIPGVSMELCGGNHLRHTGEVGLFLITRESGVAAGVRRIEALTGPSAFARLREADRELDDLAGSLRTSRDAIRRRIQEMEAERDRLEALIGELRRGADAAETVVHEATIPLDDGKSARYRGVRVKVRDADDAREIGDAFRSQESMSVAALVADSPGDKTSLFVFVTDDLVGRGVKAGSLVKEIAAVAGGRGGGRPHMAQAGMEDPDRIEEALTVGEEVLRRALSGAGP